MENTITEKHELPIMIWQLGSKEQNWIPSREHMDKFREQLEKQGLSERYHNIIVHAHSCVQVVPGSDGQPTIVNITTVPYKELQEMLKLKTGEENGND
jgi:hypothetical protein